MHSAWRYGAAIVGSLFSLMTIFEGSLVLTGASQPGYVVVPPLVMYNVFMGFVGLVAGVMLWLRRSTVVRLIGGISFAHVIVLIVVGAVFWFGGSVAIDSVRAMALRSTIWLVILWVARKTVPGESSVSGA